MKMHTKMRLFKPPFFGRSLIVLFLLITLPGCSSKPQVAALPIADGQPRMAQLARDIARLSLHVDPLEAQQVASIAINYSQQLAAEYEISRSPIMHNLLINLGIKERGLCTHWTEDLLARLQQEQFRSLEFHWAIANYDKPFRLEHSSVVVTSPGEKIADGILLDPWRFGGTLYWSSPAEDEGYRWYPREQVRQQKLAQRKRLQPPATMR